MNTLQDNNIFIIPAGHLFSYDHDKCFLIYAPFANIFYLALPQEVEELKTSFELNLPNKIRERLQKGHPIGMDDCQMGYDSAATLYLLLNEKCNFHCKYCYSANGRSNAEMSMKHIKTSLDYFLSSDRTAPTKRTVMFVGGGEPTLSWEKVVQGTEYAKQTAKRNNIDLNLRLSTNGSILNNEMIEFFKLNHFSLQVSYDVLPDIQNAQRGQFEKVDSNLKRLLDEQIACVIRSTITFENVDRIEEMVEFCHTHYPQISALVCECVVDSEYFTTEKIVDEYQNSYFTSFNKGKSLAKKLGIPLFSSIYTSVKRLREKFCYNLVCVTPYGTLTTCPNVSSPNEAGYDKAVFANISQEGEIIFNDDTYKQITYNSIHTIEACKHCWAKWNCGSGCPNQRMVYKPEIFNALCKHIKKTLLHNLVNELAEKYQTKTCRSLYEDIKQKLK